MFSNFRMSHIDQDNLHIEKEKWKQWADVYFEKVINHDIDESDLDESDSDECEDRKHLVGNTKQQKQTDRKFAFVYQSTQMKRLNRLYPLSLLLLDATCKTKKHAVPLFFAVVKTNVNYQVVCVIALPEETEPIITKALLILQSWSPDVNSKNAMVDFDEKETSALENVFPGILVFLCDLHREQSFTRWTSKADHGVSIQADEVKYRLCRIAHAVNEEELRSALAAFYNWEKYTGKLKNWFSKTWFPEIKRWCVFYRSIDLILTNTNKGTGRLNKELKSNDLENYRKCTLTKMLKVIIQEFLPKLYNTYVELKIKYTEKHKEYETALPPFLKTDQGKLLTICSTE